MRNYFKGYVNPVYHTCADIILKCFFIFSLEPTSFLRGYNYQKNFENDPIYRALSHCIVSYNHEIQNASFKFVWAFLEYDNLTAYDAEDVGKVPEHQVFSLFLHLGKLSQILIQHSIQDNIPDAQIIHHLNLVKGIMKGRCIIAQKYNFVRLTNKEITAVEPAEIRFEISNTIEMSALILILSKNTKICKIALEILNCMVQEAIICEDLDNPKMSFWSIVNNLEMYSELSSSSYVITGSIAIHKRLYQSLKKAKPSTHAIVDAWKIINVKWKDLTETIKAQNPPDQELTGKWRAFSGFLASTVSAWVVGEGEHVIEGRLSKPSKRFLLEILELVTNPDSPYLRETAREVFSRDTNPLAYHFIFITLEKKLKTVSQDSPKLSQSEFFLFEQSVLFLRAIIEYINDGEVYLAVDIASLTLSIIKKLDSVSPTERIIKLRIMYAGLVSSISKHKDVFNIQHDMVIRDEIAMIFGSWLDHAISHNYTERELESVKSTESKNTSTRPQNEKERLHKDFIVALVESLAGLTLKLSIQVPYGIREDDIYEAKIKKFSVIFGLLVRVLEKCRAEESHLHGSFMLGDRLENVKNKTIESLSKLLDANVGVGLKMAFLLAMHKDTFIRVSFIKILDNILSHSTESNSASLEVETYESLAEFLVENIPVAVSLCDVCPATVVDEFATAMLSVFESKGNSLALVKTVITREVGRADTPMEMLRRNCAATKILSIYAHSKGLAYLHASLGPFVQEIIEKPDEYLFETNSDKIPEGQTLDENIAKFQKTLKKLLYSLEDSITHIPYVFREICHTIASAADSKYIGKNASVSALSAFFFLRFVCPALVTPESYILPGSVPPRAVKQTLLVLAKMVQNLAYGTSPVVKVAIFKNARISLVEESATIERILRRLTDTGDATLFGDSFLGEDTASETTSSSSQDGATKAVDRVYLETIHRFLYTHWEDINHRLHIEARIKKHSTVDKSSNAKHPVYANKVVTSLIDSRNNPTSVYSSQGSDEEKDFRTSQKLTTIVRNLGRPKEAESRGDYQFNVPSKPNYAPHLREFLERNANRDMTAVIEKNMIHEGRTFDGTPLLILTAKNYVREELDTELVLCRFFQVACKMMHRRFILLYDATGMSGINLLPPSATAVVSSMAPDSMGQNCNTAYFYNVPNDMLIAIRNSFKAYKNGDFLNPSTANYQFFTTRDARSKFDPETFNLDPVSQHVAADTHTEFKGITIADPETDTKTQISIYLGNEYLQLHADEPFHFTKGSTGFANSVFHLSEIVRVDHSDTRPGEFVVIIGGNSAARAGDTRTIVLQSNNVIRNHEIVRAILAAKAKVPKTLSKLKNNGSYQLYQKLESSLGPLLNVSFSSMCSTDSASKTAAYNLLATVKSRFKLDFGGVELVRGRGIRLPANIFLRIQKYSTSIAENRPDLTFDVIEGMFPAFQGMSNDSRQGALMYIVPWVKGLARNVYQHEPEKFEKGATAQIIHKFLEISLDNDRDYTYMLQDVWPLIMAESDLLPVLIEEVLSLVLKHNIVGANNKRFDNVIAILTAHQSIEACDIIVDKILSISMESAYVKDYSLVNHPQWPEIMALVSLLSSMMFENPQAAFRYCFKFCFLIEMFLYTGPYSFRVSLYNLLVNMIHSFLCDDSITGESLAHITTLWKDLTSSRGNMIFGISGDMKNVAYDYPVTTIMFQVEACSRIVSELIRCVSSGQELELFYDQFSYLCIHHSTQRNSILQSRALVSLGSCKRLNVNDETLTTVLEVFYDLLSTPDTKSRTELITCCAFCISRLANGLPVDSKYYGYLFWVALALLNTQNMIIFGYGLQLLQTVVKSLDNYGIFKQMSMAAFFISCREEFKDQWAHVERMCDVSFTRQYFEQSLACMLLAGLTNGTTKATTVTTFDTLLTISARNYQYREGSSVLESTGGGESFSIMSGSSGNSGLSASMLAMKYARSVTSGGSFNSFDDTKKTFVAQPLSNSTGGDDVSCDTATTRKEDPPYMVYLFFLYLCSRSRSDLRDYLWIAGYPDDQITDNEIPDPVQKFISKDRARATVALYMGALVYNETEDEELLSQRYLEVLKFIGTVNTNNYFRLYFVVRPKVKRMIDDCSNIEVVKSALECVKMSLLNFEELQKPSKYLVELDKVLTAAGLGPTKCTGGVEIGSGLNGVHRASVLSNKTFFQEKLISVISVGQSDSGIVAIGAAPASHIFNTGSSNSHGLTSSVTRATTVSTNTNSSFGSNIGSNASQNASTYPYGYKNTVHHQSSHASTNAFGSQYSQQVHTTSGAFEFSGTDYNDNIPASYADQQLGLFVTKIIQVAKSQDQIPNSNRTGSSTKNELNHNFSFEKPSRRESTLGQRPIISSDILGDVGSENMADEFVFDETGGEIIDVQIKPKPR